MVSIKRSFQGLLGAIKTVGIVKELMEIWPNEVCDKLVVIYCIVYHYTKRATLVRLLANEGPTIYVVYLNRYFVIPLWYYLVVTFCDSQCKRVAVLEESHSSSRSRWLVASSITFKAWSHTSRPLGPIKNCWASPARILLALTQEVCSRLYVILQCMHEEQGQTTPTLWLTKAITNT